MRCTTAFLKPLRKLYLKNNNNQCFCSKFYNEISKLPSYFCRYITLLAKWQIWSDKCQREGSLIVDTWHQFLIIEILGRFLHFLLAFSIESEMIEVLQIYRWSTLIPRFGTILIKKLLKIFPIWYSFLISWWFSFRVIWIFHLTLLEKSGFTLPQNFLLTLRFLTFRFS